MQPSRVELVTSNFYEWERRGRGWYFFNSPVELEPEFAPFFPYTSSQAVSDDALRPSYLGAVGQAVKKTFSSGWDANEKKELASIEVQAYRQNIEEQLHGFAISFPEGEKITAIQIEKFLTMLTSCQRQVSFEIFAVYTAIRIQIICSASDSLTVQSQLKAYFPACIINTLGDDLGIITNERNMCAIAHLGLQDEFMRPLAIAEKFDIDPLTGVYGVLENLREDEAILIQILFKATVNAWSSSIVDSVTDSDGSSFFMDAPEMPKLALEKVSSPLFAVSMRVIGQGQTISQARHVTERVTNAIIHSSTSATNKLILLQDRLNPFEHQLEAVMYRVTCQAGMLLNAKELRTFVHYPVSITSKKLLRNLGKTKPAPRIAEGHDFVLGKNIHQGNERIPTLSTQQRLKHMHVIGATGTGKSTFLQMCIVQDIYLGNGIAVIDPHGDLIEGILPYIPEYRHKDVILIDPSDSEFPLAFNILTAHSDIEKEILASDLVAVFRRLSTSFGDQMHSVLANAILAFVESTEGGTLIDLRRFLIEKSYRDAFLKTVSDPSAVYYWQKEYPLLKSSSIGPILTRLDMFLRPKAIRNMVAQKKSLDFQSILDSQKILFIKLSQGLIGTENSYLLGTFFVSKIYQAAIARQIQSKTERKPFYFYIDEFQNFITPSMSSILSGTRKYGLGCILAHQDIIQLQRQDTELASAVISNAGTRVCFRLGDIDAKRFEEGFSSFEAQDLQNLGTGQAIVRIERPEFDFNLNTVELKDIDEETRQATCATVIKLSREIYGTPRRDVEQSLEYLRNKEVEANKEAKLEKLIDTITEQKVRPTIKDVIENVLPQVQKLEVAEKQKTAKKLIERKELSEHRYLQTLIKRMGEQRGYKATVEEPTPDGLGRVDVLLERNGKRIACEIGISTTIKWETHNVEKCLSAGYEMVVAISTEKKAIQIMEKQLRNYIDKLLQERVLVMLPQDFFAWLDKEIAEEASIETRIKGYRVKVDYKTVSEDKMNKKRDSISQAILDSIKK